MNKTAIEAIQEAITAWKGKRNFTFENKQVLHYKSPIVDGEYVLKFTNSLNSFFCNGQKIEISLTSPPFHTGTLSKNPLSDNPKGDKYRLDKFLEEFDNDFYTEVENRLNNCIEFLTTTDPLFF
ncbi:MAG: hypothetical protein U0T75_11930 [Chitinophagales bacterium]